MENSHIISTIVLVIKWVGNLYPISRIVGLTFQPFPIIVQFLTRLQQQQKLATDLFFKEKMKSFLFSVLSGTGVGSKSNKEQ